MLRAIKKIRIYEDVFQQIRQLIKQLSPAPAPSPKKKK